MRCLEWVVEDDEGLWGSVRAVSEQEARAYLDAEEVEPRGSLDRGYTLRLGERAANPR